MIILATLTLSSVFIYSNRLLYDKPNELIVFKAQNIATNIVQYHDLVVEYIGQNYATMHIAAVATPTVIEHITLLPNISNIMPNSSSQHFVTALNYMTLTFNYVPHTLNQTRVPLLYMLTSWNAINGSMNNPNVNLDEVMGQLHQLLSVHIYSGNSTYWSYPWIFKQHDCHIIDLYSSVPQTLKGQDLSATIQKLFYQWCQQLQQQHSYKLLNYIYLQFILSDMSATTTSLIVYG